MGNNGLPRRIQKRVIQLVKKTGCWDHDESFGNAVERMARFCIYHKTEVDKWMKKETREKK
jgi:hypothetical protein